MIYKATLMEVGANALLSTPLLQHIAQFLNIVHASDAEQVIDVTSDNESIDLALLDVDSLGASAKQTCVWLKTDNETQHIPVLILASEGVDISQWINNGAVDIFYSDSEEQLVEVRLKSWLDLNRKTQLLTDIASLDPLTSLANKQRFDEYLDIEWRRSLREFYPLSLIKIDIDNFTAFNDSYGLGSGDDVMKRIARLLEKISNRAADMVSRYSNDEFLILLPTIELDNALLMAERMVKAIEALSIAHKSSSVAHVITVSVGVATIEPSRDKRYLDLFDEAQEMMYLAQQGGGNQAHGVAI
jgi:diguanylate cyclase (GGDEF)-like protein